MKIKVKKLSPNAKIPTKGSSEAAGLDLYSAEDCIVPKKGKFLVPLGIALAVPKGYYGRMAPRSGLAVKKFINVGAGVVDSDYRGQIYALLFNFGEEDFEVKTGDRIAQLIITEISMVDCEETDRLEETKRGEGGFGSTGTN